ncbi:MAG TPA: FAD/NAD(P)-binding oxidoreductase [Nitrososphaeraceae archaeon]|nr:FAD/NAD(P)-binding oxidoreductase [Nitrososphaeraceae archaeon]
MLKKSRPSILVIGGSFAGLTAAFEIKRKLKDKVDVRLIARQEQFVFIPSLIWLVPGWRRSEQITFDLKHPLESKNIEFICARVDQILPEHNRINTTSGNYEYDYLVIATGPYFDWDEVSGMGPDKGYTESICSLPHAIEARKSWNKFLNEPGPVVLGSTQFASCFGAEYEIAFNIDRALRESKVRKKTPVTFITAEPFLGHFGIGGMGKGQKMVEWFFKKLDINWITNAWIEKVTQNEIYLKDGKTIPFKFAIIIPPFKGVQAVRDSVGLGDERGFIPVNVNYQHKTFQNIYAAGVAVAVKPPAKTPVPCGVPKTGYMSEVMAKVAAHNIIYNITGEKKTEELPFPNIRGLCIMDAGKQGVVMISDHIFAPRKYELLIPGPWSHWAKIIFEKYFMWKLKRGMTYLP